MKTLKKRSLLYLGVFLISVAILSLELLLTRIFSVIMWYHFAFMAISIALFGFGLSGMYVYIFSNKFPREKLFGQLTIASIFFSLSLILLLTAILNLKLTFFFTFASFIKLALIYVISVIPFFFGGLFITLAITHQTNDISRIYFFDLIGASLGALLVIPLLNIFGGISSLIVISLIICIVSLFFSLSNKKLVFTSICLIVVIFSLLLINMKYDIFRIDFAKGFQDKEAAFSKWNSFSRVDAIEHPDGKIVILNIDSNAETKTHRFDGDLNKLDELKDEIYSLGYHLKNNSNVLIIGPGGGRDVLTALIFNNTVTGVEINDIIVNDLLKGKYENFSGGLYTTTPNVNVVVDEGRSYIRRSEEKYDLIQATLIDTWAATSAGAFTLSENNLYTVEAFEDYINHLSDDGILSISRWAFETPQETIRLAAISLEAMERLGIENPEKHLLIVKQPLDVSSSRDAQTGVANFMLKKSEFTKEEVDKISDINKKNGFEILYSPFLKIDNKYNELIFSNDKKSFYDDYELNIRPTTDDNPFFFYTVKFKDTFNFLNLKEQAYENKIQIKTNVGLYILSSLLIIVFALVLLFIFMPLIFFKKNVFEESMSKKIKILLYFTGLGIGFILIEIALMQKFMLFLGHPIYALSVVLLSILLFGGIGSFSTRNIQEDKIKKHLIFSLVGLIILVFLYILIIPIIFNKLISLSIFYRILIAIALLSPLAFLMGRPFPIGIKTMNNRFHDLTPWIWGVNGASSVFGSVLSIFLAMNLGFNIVLIIGIVSYAFSLLLSTELF